MSRQIEYWYDETSDSENPVFCVSLCDQDGDEIKCLSTHEDEESALQAAIKAANKREIDVYFRDANGTLCSTR